MPLPMTLVDLQGHLNYFCLKIIVSYFFGVSDRSPGNLAKDDVVYNLK